MVVSKSLANRRLRPNQAKVRSTTQPWQHLKALGLIRPLDNLERPLPVPGKRGLQLLASVAAIGKDMAQPGEEIADRSHDTDRAVAILDVGCVHLRANQMTVGVRDDVALTPVDLLARIIT